MPPAEAAPVETAYFMVEGAGSATDWDKVSEALEDVPGVSLAKPTGLTLMTRETEVAVTAAKGKVNAQAIVKGFAAAGLKAEPEAVDTWNLSVSPEQCDEHKSTFSLGGIQASLAKVEGVTAVSCASAQAIQVTGYAPHVSTAKLLAAMQSDDCKAQVQTESVRCKVKGADSADKLEQARAKLALALGVVEAKAGQDGAIRLVREKGRAGLERLNRALKGTGWSVELSG